MLKLVRNAFGDKRVFIDENGKFVQWKYIEQLHNLQEQEGLHLGNKLKLKHIIWMRKKMNVKLAAQLLSESVAKSLQFCVNEEISEFKDCEPTMDFLILFNNLFDIMNTRNLHARGYKCPLQRKNFDEIKEFLSKAEAYIINLKLPDGQYMIKSNRRTGFLGFIFCTRSLQTVYDRFVAGPNSFLDFYMSYKMSQDHIELFFGQVRRMGGWNNNPTVRQFSAAYKKILVHN